MRPGGTLDMAMALSELIEATLQNVRAWRWLNAIWRYQEGQMPMDVYQDAASVAQEAHDRVDKAVEQYEALGLS